MPPQPAHLPPSVVSIAVDLPRSPVTGGPPIGRRTNLRPCNASWNHRRCRRGHRASKVAVDWAARDAALRMIPLTVVNVLYPPVVMTFAETPMPMPPEYMQWQEDEGRNICNYALKTVEESTKQLGPIDVDSELMTGSAVPTLVDLSKDAQMVVGVP